MTATESLSKLMERLALRRSHQDTVYSAEKCQVCATAISEIKSDTEVVTHNPETCGLVNIALHELGVHVDQPIRINIYPGAGPLRGFYFTADPYTIHISEDAYAQLREYIIFHETKHLVDCLLFGRSEEITPDSFARSLCVKYGYNSPPESAIPT